MAGARGVEREVEYFQLHVMDSYIRIDYEDGSRDVIFQLHVMDSLAHNDNPHSYRSFQLHVMDSRRRELLFSPLLRVSFQLHVMDSRYYPDMCMVRSSPFNSM